MHGFAGNPASAEGSIRQLGRGSKGGARAHLGVGHVLPLVAGLAFGIVVKDGQGGAGGAGRQVGQARINGRAKGCMSALPAHSAWLRHHAIHSLPRQRAAAPHPTAAVSLVQPALPSPVEPSGHSQLNPPCKGPVDKKPALCVSMLQDGDACDGCDCGGSGSITREKRLPAKPTRLFRQTAPLPQPAVPRTHSLTSMSQPGPSNLHQSEGPWVGVASSMTGRQVGRRPGTPTSQPLPSVASPFVSARRRGGAALLAAAAGRAGGQALHCRRLRLDKVKG